MFEDIICVESSTMFTMWTLRNSDVGITGVFGVGGYVVVDSSASYFSHYTG